MLKSLLYKAILNSNLKMCFITKLPIPEMLTIKNVNMHHTFKFSENEIKLLNKLSGISSKKQNPYENEIKEIGNRDNTKDSNNFINKCNFENKILNSISIDTIQKFIRNNENLINIIKHSYKSKKNIRVNKNSLKNNNNYNSEDVSNNMNLKKGSILETTNEYKQQNIHNPIYSEKLVRINCNYNIIDCLYSDKIICDDFKDYIFCSKDIIQKFDYKRNISKDLNTFLKNIHENELLQKIRSYEVISNDEQDKNVDYIKEFIILRSKKENYYDIILNDILNTIYTQLEYLSEKNLIEYTFECKYQFNNNIVKSNIAEKINFLFQIEVENNSSKVLKVYLNQMYYEEIIKCINFVISSFKNPNKIGNINCKENNKSVSNINEKCCKSDKLNCMYENVGNLIILYSNYLKLKMIT